MRADQAAAADSWAPSHCSADAANYYVAESAEDWLVVVVAVAVAAAAAAAAELAVMASPAQVSSLELVSSKLSSC